MNSPNNNCPSTRITTNEDQDFSGQMGDIFYVGIRKEDADAYAEADKDKLINKKNDEVLQKKDLNCPPCQKTSSCPPVIMCPTPKPDIQCNSIYYFIIGFILSLIISGLVYYFFIYKEE
jgi:hypothetical protein